MINVNEITSTLRSMPDRQLQQYAMMHKGNPYILSLAISESNQRKQLRMAAQGQAGGMPQPKVADAAIAGMAAEQLPENRGIAQIPAPNIQAMADGGIAGYDDAGMTTSDMGGMFDFAQRSEPVVRMSGGGVARYNGATGSVTGVSPELLSKYQQEATEMAMGTRIQFSPDVKAVVGQIQAAQEGSYLKEEQQRMLAGGRFKAFPSKPTGDAKQANSAGMFAPTDSAAYDPTENLKKLAQTNARYTTPSAPKNAEEAAMLNRYPTTKPAADKVPPAPTSTGGVKDLLPAIPKFDTSFKPATAPTAADAKAKAANLYDSKGQILSLEGKRLQARQDIANETDTRRAQLEAFSKEQGPAFASYEKLLQKEELQDATDKEKAGLMSLMKGFLAMAAGESPNAATNIAKGAMVGMGDYGDALKEFKKAAKERNKAMADIENARRAEAKGDFKDMRAFEDRAAERIAASDDRFTGLISQITGKEADVAASLFNNMTNSVDETNRMMFKEAQTNKRFMAEQAASNARAQTPDKTVFDALVRQYGDPVKAAEALQKMKAEKFNLYEAYNKYLTAFAGKDTMTPPMAFDLFAKQFIPEVNPNKNTTIRTQPGG